jgi:tetratricopeptide (TPR) repeat protein
MLLLEVQQNIEAEQLKQAFASTIATIARFIPDSPTSDHLTAVTIEIPHIIEAVTHCPDWLQVDDLIWPFIGLGRFYTGQGAYAIALTWQEQCFSLVRDRLDESHPSLSTSLNNLAAAYTMQGRYSEAEPLFIEDLNLSQRIFGEIHVNVATSFNNLAELYRLQGNYSGYQSGMVQ